MTIPAKAVMTRDPVTVSPDTSVAEIAKRMLAHRISAVPVVDPAGRPLGVVSEGDVLRHFGAEFQGKRAQWLRHLAEGEALSPQFLAAIAIDRRRAGDLMQGPAITAGEDASLAEIGDTMLGKGIKRVLITRDGLLVGIVSRADVVRAVVENLPDLLEPTG